MICPKCKSEIKDDSKFCGKCGQKIPRCPTCGRPILERARFCVYDGTMIPDDMLNLLPEETAEDITENQEQQERREQAVVKKTGRQKKKKVFVVLGIILGAIVGYLLYLFFETAYAKKHYVRNNTNLPVALSSPVELSGCAPL